MEFDSVKTDYGLYVYNYVRIYMYINCGPHELWLSLPEEYSIISYEAVVVFSHLEIGILYVCIISVDMGTKRYIHTYIL